MFIKNNFVEHYFKTSFGNIILQKGKSVFQNIKPHFHDCYTIILVYEGTGDYSTINNEFVLSEGNFLVLNPFEVHTGNPINEEPWSCISIYVPTNYIKNICGCLENNDLPYLKQKIVENSELFNLGLKMFLQDNNESNFNPTESTFQIFLKTVFAECSFNCSNRSKSNDKHQLAEKIRDFIHETYEEDITLDMLSQEFGTTKPNLIKIFKENYHLTPHQYIINLKIEKAKKMLEENESLTEVAYSSGFFDQSHFIRHFKKIMGVSPKEFVKSLK